MQKKRMAIQQEFKKYLMEKIRESDKERNILKFDRQSYRHGGVQYIQCSLRHCQFNLPQQGFHTTVFVLGDTSAGKSFIVEKLSTTRDFNYINEPGLCFITTLNNIVLVQISAFDNAHQLLPNQQTVELGSLNKSSDSHKQLLKANKTAQFLIEESVIEWTKECSQVIILVLQQYSQQKKMLLKRLICNSKIIVIHNYRNITQWQEGLNKFRADTQEGFASQLYERLRITLLGGHKIYHFFFFNINSSQQINTFSLVRDKIFNPSTVRLSLEQGWKMAYELSIKRLFGIKVNWEKSQNLLSLQPESYNDLINELKNHRKVSRKLPIEKQLLKDRIILTCKLAMAKVSATLLFRQQRYFVKIVATFQKCSQLFQVSLAEEEPEEKIIVVVQLDPMSRLVATKLGQVPVQVQNQQWIIKIQLIQQ